MAVVLRKNEFEVRFSCKANLFAIGVHLHSLLNGGVAGCNKAISALYFNNADSACTDFVNLFKVAKSGNIHFCKLCRFENGYAIVCFNGHSVNEKLYHLYSLPPLNPAWP